MVDLKKLTSESLDRDGWRGLVNSLDEVTRARTDPRFFRQVDRFIRHLREIASIAVELNCNYSAAEKAYEHVRSAKIISRHKTINKFEDIQKQTYDICLEALKRDFDNMYKAFRERNLEELENQYRQITRWPIRFQSSA